MSFPYEEVGFLYCTIGTRASERIRITLLRAEDEFWRSAKVEVACGIWRGRFDWDFFEGELRRFATEIQALYDSLSGTAALEPMEPNLTLKFAGDGKGHILVEGRAQDQFWTGTYLVFELSLDQTELPAIIASLNAMDPQP